MAATVWKWYTVRPRVPVLPVSQRVQGRSATPLVQLPIGPPSSFVITMQAERGRPPASPSGHELNCFGFWGVFESARRLAWMLNADEHRPLVRRDEDAGDFADSGAHEEPTDLPLTGSAQSIWLLPNPA